MNHTTLTCNPSFANVSTVGYDPGITPGSATAKVVAETSQQLLQGILLLGQLQPFLVSLVQDMAVPAATWPRGLVVNSSMVIAGLPPPAPRTILDLYQVHMCGLPHCCGLGGACVAWGGGGGLGGSVAVGGGGVRVWSGGVRVWSGGCMVHGVCVGWGGRVGAGRGVWGLGGGACEGWGGACVGWRRACVSWGGRMWAGGGACVSWGGACVGWGGAWLWPGGEHVWAGRVLGCWCGSEGAMVLFWPPPPPPPGYRLFHPGCVQGLCGHDQRDPDQPVRQPVCTRPTTPCGGHLHTDVPDVQHTVLEVGGWVGGA